MGTMDYVLGQLRGAQKQILGDPEDSRLIIERLLILFEANREWFDKLVEHPEPDQRDRQLGNVRMQLDAVMGERDTLRRELSDMRATLAEVAEEGAKAREMEETLTKEVNVRGKILLEQDKIIAEQKAALITAQRKLEQGGDVGQPLTEFLSNRYHGHPRFFELIERMVVIHEAKNRDYAGGEDYFANFRGCEQFGLDPYTGVLVRLSDKWSRICTLSREKRLDAPFVDEKLLETHTDAANYHLIAAIVLEEQEKWDADHTEEYGQGTTSRGRESDSGVQAPS